MYNQKYIDTFGEDYLNRMIESKSELPFRLHSMDSMEQMGYFALQHFLIKSYLNNNKRDVCVKLLKKYYEDFKKYPSKFYNSPLISNSTLDKLIGDHPFKQAIIDIRNMFYNSKVLSNLLEKRKTQILTDDEQRLLYANLQKFDYLNNETQAKFVEAEIRNIINTDYSKLTVEQLTFYCQYISNSRLKEFDFKTNVVIGTEPPDKDGMLTRGFQSNNYIFINKMAFNNIADVTKTICHETQHSIQHYKNENRIATESFEMAQHSLFVKYLNTSEYDSYHSNYYYSAIELDAEKHGHFYAAAYLRMFGREDLADEVRKTRVQVYDTRNYYDYMLDKDKRPLPTDKYIVENMTEIIKKHPEELKNHLVLKEIFNPDGSTKSYEEIINARMNANSITRGIYTNFINYGIKNNDLNSINLDGKTDEEIHKMLNMLQSVYADNVVQNLKAYFNDETRINPFKHQRYSDGQVITVTKYKMDIAYKTLSFINNNFDKFIKPYMNNRINNNTCPIFSFIYYFRDFDFINMINDVLKQSSEIQDKFKEIKYMNDRLIEKYNRAYVETRLNSYPEEIKSFEIKNELGATVTFYDYCLNTIPKKMNSHQYFIHYGEEIEISTLLNVYANNIKEQIEEDRSSHRGR
jgi:hypothetical protein